MHAILPHNVINFVVQINLICFDMNWIICKNTAHVQGIWIIHPVGPGGPRVAPWCIYNRGPPGIHRPHTGADRAHPGTPRGRREDTGNTREEPGTPGTFSPRMIPGSAPEQPDLLEWHLGGVNKILSLPRPPRICSTGATGVLRSCRDSLTVQCECSIKTLFYIKKFLVMSVYQQNVFKLNRLSHYVLNHQILTNMCRIQDCTHEITYISYQCKKGKIQVWVHMYIKDTSQIINVQLELTRF